MELRHLRYFIAVAECDNISRAATRLHVTQPSLSRQIRDLEQMLGLTLFERGGKSLSITDAGRSFLKEARAVVARADEAYRFAKQLAESGCQRIRVGYAPSLNVDLLPLTLQKLQAQYPELKIQLMDLSSFEMVEALRSNEIDVALMVRTESLHELGLAFRILAERAVCVAASPSHEIFNATSIDFSTITEFPLLSYAQQDYPEYHAWLNRLFEQRRLPLYVAEEHDGSSSLVASLQLGQGIALVQEGMESFAGARLKLQKIEGNLEPFVLGVAWREDTTDAIVLDFVAKATMSIEAIEARRGLDLEGSARPHPKASLRVTSEA